MKSISRPTLALLIAIVSTAALGPGTLFPDQSHAERGHRLQVAASSALTLPDLQALMLSSLPDLPAGTPVALLAESSMAFADFLAIDFTQGYGNGTGALAGSPGGIAAAGGNSDIHAGYSGNTANAANAANAAHSPGEGAQLARSGGLPGAAVGAVSGFRGGPAPTGPSAIVLDDAALVDHDIQQLPLLALVPAPGDFDAVGPAGKDAGAATAVPAPATLLLLGPGLLGLLGARRARRLPVTQALPA
jgi:hypothetical protein